MRIFSYNLLLVSQKVFLKTVFVQLFDKIIRILLTFFAFCPLAQSSSESDSEPFFFLGGSFLVLKGFPLPDFLGEYSSSESPSLDGSLASESSSSESSLGRDFGAAFLLFFAGGFFPVDPRFFFLSESES